MARTRRWRVLVLAGLLVVVLAGTPGCGYLKNVRDDFMDVGTLSAGIAPPVISTAEESKAIGPFPPALGAYIEATSLFHLGALMKGTGDLEWDRRGAGVVVDRRVKFGLGPFHHVRINQDPIYVNAYKEEGNELDEWRMHMRQLRDPLLDTSAKELIFRARDTGLPFMYKGWQDWENLSVEVAIPEPFITHTGYYFRAGLNPCQMFDAVLSLVCLDLYDDAAYRLDGSLKYGPGSPETAQGPDVLDRFMGDQ